ncbi:hypothetical protein BCV69DRAFT_281081 [Microstroma glucosiphilum]|uniref:PHD-type domain-containing protein n=1 Tax=Pseudomicrostroma glucosiphilum TaxID=1684307 RepID=A0A316UB57_9BASI|nr:hypothetical protein BCV69DRAFT_281081 [Pseudomicrostroma glucosiphilum]PWN22084.1 hypothetical protein BCV69DRAFT_281081 [Pseudomicrostroma glucosiphilum]
MVGCDNDECPYEWFHLSCLGMTEPPADNRQWFCQDCSQAKSGGGIAGRADVAPSAIKAGRKSGGRKSQGATVGTNGKKR